MSMLGSIRWPLCIDPATGFSLWRWQWTACDRVDGQVWGMVPADRARLLPLIVHPCKGAKELEYEFLYLPEFP